MPRAHATFRHFALSTVVIGATLLTTTGHAVEPSPPPLDARIADDAKASKHPRLEQIFSDGDFERGLQETKVLLSSSPDDPELLIHRFRFLFEKAEQRTRTDVSVDKEAIYTEMFALIERGLALSPEHPRFLWGKGIVTARRGTHRGIFASLRSATTIESLFQKVSDSDYRYRSLHDEEVLPCDAMLALGMFYRMVPDMFLVQLIAGTKGDLKKSLALVEKSAKCQSGRIRAEKELGVTELCIADKDNDKVMLARGLSTLKNALTVGNDRAIDHIDRRHIKMLLADPSLACSYSRDGQQDLDEKQLKK